MNPNQALRILQILVGFCFSLFYLAVAANNCIDYDTNFQFVKSTMTMASVAADNPLKVRSIQTVQLHHFAYLILILFEWVMAFLFARGTYILVKAGRETNEVFHQNKGDILLAHSLSFLFWFFFFIVVAGEWFFQWPQLDTSKSLLFSCSSLLAIQVLWLEEREKTEKVNNTNLIS